MATITYKPNEEAANNSVSDVLSDCQLSLFPLKKVNSNGNLGFCLFFQGVEVWI